MTSLSDIRVLVVEDSRKMRLLLRQMLAAAGLVNVREAANAPAGYKALLDPTDLVIVDWQMHPIDGLTFTRTVRVEGPRPYVPIVMLTAHTERARVMAARDAGVSGFVKKPVGAQMLFSRISNALTESRPFVRSPDFVGPDRRRARDPNYKGPLRRATDEALDMVDLDDARWRA